MNFVSEREEWLLAWADAKRVKELSFLEPGAPPPRAAQDDSRDVFFSEVVETCGGSIVCRGAGAVVDIFDISPGVTSLFSWRVLLPEPLVPELGLCASAAVGAPAVSLMFLTKASTIHTVEVQFDAGSAGAVPTVRTAASLPWRWPSSPSALCALGGGLAAVGCRDGTLRVVSLRRGCEGQGCELSDASLLARITQGLTRSANSAILALACAGAGSGQGMWLLSYSADGRVCLWEASERHGRLLASTAAPGLAAGAAFAAAGAGGGGGTPLARFAGCGEGAACLAMHGSLVLIKIGAGGGTLSARQLQPPFAGALPRFATLSAGCLWSWWTGCGREQLFRLDLEEADAAAWTKGALDAGLIPADAPAALRSAALEGCHRPGSLATASTPEEEQAAHRPVLTLQQQQEACRGEEGGFDVVRGSAMVADQLARGGDGRQVLDHIVDWWVDRVLLPGRFGRAEVVAALQDGGTWCGGAAAERRRGNLGGDCGAGELRSAVEEHLRRQAAACVVAGAADADAVAAEAAAAAGAELLQRCCAAARPGRQVCRLSASAAWAPHAWSPAGDVDGASSGSGPAACMVVLYAGGVSCVRPVHHWSERWWATCQVFRDMSNYSKVDVDSLLGLSSSVEWRACVSGWFLSQCAGGANIGLAISAAPRGAAVRPVLQQLAQHVPQSLAGHVARAVQWLGSPSLGADTENLRQLLSTCCRPQRWEARASGHGLDALRGTWSTAAAVAAPCLADRLRGGIATSEGDCVCASLRDLALLGAYEELHPSAAHDEWRGLCDQLEQDLPLYTAVQRSLGACVDVRRGDVALRAADAWASHFRPPAEACLGLRPPLASLLATQYALVLVRHGCWQALRQWCKHQECSAFASYAAAREWLAAGRPEAAEVAFEQAQAGSDELVQCLQSAGGGHEVEVGGPPLVTYLQHVAALHGRAGLAKEEQRWQSRAAEAAEAAGCAEHLRQRLWTAAFEGALALDMLEEACDILVHVGRFEGHLYSLARKLRSGGRIDLMLRLPQQHRNQLINNLHEHALMSTPVVGSDSLLCYNHLYALHFSSMDYLKAAAVAHGLHTALGHALQHVAVVQPAGGDERLAEGMQPWTGDCISKAAGVPGCTGGSCAVDPAAPAPREGGPSTASASLWPILDQQRNAALMLHTALSLTSERSLLVPVAQGAAEAAPMVVDDAGAGGCDAAALEAAASAWLAAAGRGNTRLVSLEEVERQLAVLEARLVLCGDGGRDPAPEATKLDSPAGAAKKVAELGLLGLALRVAAAERLDPWQVALQPFLRLVEVQGQGADKLASLAEAARGPAQDMMFLRCDGAEALGTGGDTAAGWWQTLEHALRVAGGGGGDPLAVAEGRMNATRRRLYSLAAEELLSRHPDGALPAFLAKALSQGHAWVSLLRLYMKHSRIEDAVDLLGAQLQRCQDSVTSAGAVRVERKWTPLQDFPISLVVQLQRVLGSTAEHAEGLRGVAADRRACAAKLDRILAQFKLLFEDVESERSARR